MVDAGFMLTATNGASLQLQAAGEIAFQQSFRLSGGVLDLSAGGAISQSSALTLDTLVINGTSGANLTSANNQIGTLAGLTASGDVALTDGAGLTVSGTANVGAHALTLTAGSADLTIANTVTGSAVTLTSGGAINVSSSGSVVAAMGLYVSATQASTFGGVISGTGTLYQQGTGALTLTAANTYGGGTTITNGTLRISAGGTTGSIMGPVTDNGTLEFSRSDAITFAGAISGSGAVVVDGGGTLTLSAASTYSGGTTISAGVLQLNNQDPSGNEHALGTGLITLSGGTLEALTTSILGNNTTIGSGGGVLEAAPQGDLVIGGAQANGLATATTFTLNGALTIGSSTDTGEVDFGADTVSGTGSVTVAGGLLTSLSGKLGLLFASAGTTTGESGATVAFSAQGAAGGGIHDLEGDGRIQSYLGNNSNPLTRQAVGQALEVQAGHFSGVIANQTSTKLGALEKVSSGTLVLSGANTYSAGTQIDSGVLDLDHATLLNGSAITSGAAGTGAITFTSGAQTLQVEHVALSSDPGHTLAYQLTGFAAGDVIDLRGVTITDTVAYNASTGQLQVMHGATLEATLNVGTGYSGYTFSAVAETSAGGAANNTESSGGIDIIVAASAPPRPQAAAAAEEERQPRRPAPIPA